MTVTEIEATETTDEGWRPTDDERIAKVHAFATLADYTRLEMIDHLRKSGPLTVTEMQACIPHLTQPTISHHLRRLRLAGIVTRKKDGVWATYTLVPKRLREIKASVL